MRDIRKKRGSFKQKNEKTIFINLPYERFKIRHENKQPQRSLAKIHIIIINYYNSTTNYRDSENKDDDSSQKGLRRNRNNIEDSRHDHGVNRSNERRSYDERRICTMDDHSEEQLSDCSERRRNERRTHLEHCQGTEDRRSQHRVEIDTQWTKAAADRHIQQLEDELAEMKNMNKKLKAQVSEF